MATMELESPIEAARQRRDVADAPRDVSAIESQGEWARICCEAIEGGDVSTTPQHLVDVLARWLNVERVVLGWQRRRHGGRLAAVSGQPTLDRRCEYARALEAALAETLLHGELLRWPVPAEGQQPGLLPTFRRLSSVTAAQSVIGMRLDAVAGTPAAALLVLGDAAVLESLQLEAQLHSVAAPVAGLLRILDEASPTGPQSLFRWGRRVQDKHTWRLFAAAALVVALAAFVPVSDRIRCPCVLEPQVRRFVAAPFEGTLQKVTAELGHIVSAGELLAQLDERPLRTELSLLKAQHDEAAKRRDSALAKGQAAHAQLADLEAAQAASKIEHLQHQLDQLTVTSPIAGVIVRGDLQRAEGAPVTHGQSLFEIAPLSPLIAELAVAEDEVRLVKPGMPVTIRAAAYPGSTFTGQIERIHPRAEVRDAETVFIAEVLLANESGDLRPGMQGRAVIAGSAKPLAWTWLRRPVTRMARWFWW